MTITPLSALALPAGGLGAVKLAQRVSENRPFASFLANVLGKGAGDPAAATAAAPPEVQWTRQLDEFAAMVQQRLAAAGIRTSIRFELAGDADGRLHVVGQHPKKQRIEQILAGDEELSAAFHRLAASGPLRPAAEPQADFAAQYVSGGVIAASPPPAAGPDGFSVVINGDKVSVGSHG